MVKAYIGLKWGESLTGDSDQHGLRPARIYIPLEERVLVIGREVSNSNIFAAVLSTSGTWRNGEYIGYMSGGEELSYNEGEKNAFPRNSAVGKFYDLVCRWYAQYNKPMPVKPEILKGLLG